MSENSLDRKGELGRYFTRPNQKLTPQCEPAGGILHPCMIEGKNGKYSKIWNTSCLPTKPRQTVQSQIRLLLKKQPDAMIWDFPVCFSDKHFMNSSPYTQHFI